MKGFTLIELILTIVLTSAIFAVSAISLEQGLSSYYHISERSTNLLAARYALDRMARELALSEDLLAKRISSISDTRIDFFDSTGVATNFLLSGTQILRSGQLLLDNVTSLTFTGFDFNNNITTIGANIRRVGINFQTLPPGQTAPLRLRTYIFIRNFMYENYK